MPIDASRKRNSVIAGNAFGHLLDRRQQRSPRRPRRARYAGAATSVAVVPDQRSASTPRSRTAAIAASSEITIMVRYSAVRLAIVSGSPTDGGFAGYFTNGTR